MLVEHPNKLDLCSRGPQPQVCGPVLVRRLFWYRAAVGQKNGGQRNFQTATLTNIISIHLTKKPKLTH